MDVKDFSNPDNWYYEPEKPHDLSKETMNPWLRNLENEISTKAFGQPVYPNAALKNA